MAGHAGAGQRVARLVRPAAVPEQQGQAGQGSGEEGWGAPVWALRHSPASLPCAKEAAALLRACQPCPAMPVPARYLHAVTQTALAGAHTRRAPAPWPAVPVAAQGRARAQQRHGAAALAAAGGAAASGGRWVPRPCPCCACACALPVPPSRCWACLRTDGHAPAVTQACSRASWMEWTDGCEQRR